ncbi:MAG: glycosyltransferase, partial [Phaeodactylibacter sp.]|nr:glycosyltransferase [Phaeodactylibacter sp.]
RIRSLINSVNPFNWIKVGRMIRKLAPDLIVVRFWLPFMGPCLGTILRIARKNKKTRVVCIADNIIPHERRPGDRLFTAYFIKPVDGFVVMSRSVGEDLRQFTRTKPYIYLPHPIYDNYGEPVSRAAALQHLQLPADRHYLLFFGFLRDYKGLYLNIEALADPRLKELPLKLIVAGEYYSNEAKYEALIEQFGVRDQLILHTRYIPKEEVRYFFGAADLIVQPYRSATQSGISQLAYHFEKPVLVTNVGGLPEIIEHGKVGYVVEQSPEIIAASIQDYFKQARQLEMTRGLIENKAQFSWSHFIRGLESLHREVENFG